MWADIDQHCPEFGKAWTDVDQFGPTFGQIRGEFDGMLTDVDRILTDIDRIQRPNVAQVGRPPPSALLILRACVASPPSRDCEGGEGGRLHRLASSTRAGHKNGCTSGARTLIHARLYMRKGTGAYAWMWQACKHTCTLHRSPPQAHITQLAKTHAHMHTTSLSTRCEIILVPPPGWSKCGRIQASFGHSGRCWSTSVRFGRNCIKFGLNLANFWTTPAKSGQCWPSSGSFGGIRTKSGRICLISGRIWSKSGVFWTIPGHVWQIGPSLAETRPSLVDSGACLAEPG